MILQCPECYAKFKIPDGALGDAGREVRCGKCAHLWHAMPEGVDASVLDVAGQPEETNTKSAKNKSAKAPDIDAVLAGKAHTSKPSMEEALGNYKPPKKVRSKKVFWGVMSVAYVLLIMVCAGLWSLVHAPEILGFKGSGGFAFERMELTDMPKIGGDRFTMKPMYKIGGTIRNTSAQTKMVPVIRVTLTDQDGAVVYRRESKDRKSLPPGDTVDFLMENLEQPEKAHTHFIVEMGDDLELALRSVEVENAQ